MAKKHNPNLEILKLAAEQLGKLKDEMVFVGGCATGLLITDPAAHAVRMTRDVDAIVQVLNHADYYQLNEKLRQQGFKEDSRDDAPICRWLADSVVLDVMPTKTEILGFGNQWYVPAMENAEVIEIAPGLDIRHVSAPYFLITKLEAFTGRGNHDYMMSHDMEDIISVIDGRDELLEEINQTDPKLKEELALRFAEMLSDDRFTDAIPGHLLPDVASQDRVKIVMQRIKIIAAKK